MTELPSGTVTFLFTDVEGSTRLWEEYPDAMQSASARHDELVRGAIEDHNGYVVKTTGDGFHAAFATASDAVDAAIDAQLALAAEPWKDTGPLRVRVGVHTGAAEVRDGDYYSSAVNRAARLMSVGHGGQILVSLATNQLVRDSGVELDDLGSHHLRDLGEPERIFQVVHPELGTEFAALRSLDSFPTNLPLQVTTFVGRDDDVTDVIEALGQSRVVTLIGVGGVGKTRLAVQTAAEVLPRFRDGVWLCELGPLSDPDQVPDVVADALGVQQRPGQSMADSLVIALRSKEQLVVLDNCEHLLDAAAQLVAAIVGACPGVTVLATGREGMGVRGERMMMVRSLPLPSATATIDEILAADAVTLFTERSAHAGGAVDLDADTATTIAQLCRRLDGIPLAIELAAARTRMMSPQEISARLDERFRLLTGGSRTAVERHQTLRQAVDWSYDLLDERDRTILDRLGVFSGGFTLEAAETVVGADDLDPLDVLDGVAQLVDKSLVVAEREHHDTRYRLLETIRQYALERLDDRGEADAMRRRHATWCAEFITRVSDGVRGRDEVAWLARFDREVDNIRAALTWATGADDAALSLSLIGNFGYFTVYGTRVGYVLGPWATAALATTGAEDDPRFASVLGVRAQDHTNHRRTNEAVRDARRAVALMAEPGSPFSAIPWSALGVALMWSGHAAELEDSDAFVAAARATGDDHTIATALIMAAGLSYVSADLARCLEFAEEAALLAQRIGNPTLIATSATYLGGALGTIDPRRARSSLELATETFDAIGSGAHRLAALAWLVRTGADAADPQWAAAFRRGLELADEGGDSGTLLMSLDVYAQALATTERIEGAAMLSAAVVALSPHVANPISIDHRDQTNERLVARLGQERFAELTAWGAALDYQAAVALALTELDHVIVQDDKARK